MKTTLRDRLAEYNFNETEQGATIEQNWSLIKAEPVSAAHKECAAMEDGRIILPNDASTKESSAKFGNYSAGLGYVTEDGRVQFECTYKLTPNGVKAGTPTLFSGVLKVGDKVIEVENRTSEWLKNTIFGRGGWVSQKGFKVGAVPTSRTEAKDFAEKWSAELLQHLDRVEEILATYEGGVTLPDFSQARQICKMRAYRHSLTLYREYDAQQRAEQAERTQKTLAKKAEKSGLSAETSAEDALKLLKAAGLDMAALFAAMQAQA